MLHDREEPVAEEVDDVSARVGAAGEDVERGLDGELDEVPSVPARCTKQLCPTSPIMVEASHV